MKLILKIYLLLLVPLAIMSCNTEKHIEKKGIPNGPNIILLIGDGMGLSQLSAAFYYGNGKSNFDRFKEIGFINTSSIKHKITDSSAGGTAFSCGEKTYNGAVGVNSDSVSIPNIVEILSEKNYNTGVISTSSVTHATPACFYAHVVNRGMQDEIAEQLVESDIDFFAGGGTSYFSNRKDSISLIKKLIDNDYVINPENDLVTTEADSKYGFLLASDGMPTMLEGRGDFLLEYTKLALNYFSQKPENFFLMVEGSQIDWAGHDNNADYLIAELLDFDSTVGVALDFAEKNQNTLVIVLADHETGGFTLAPDGSDYSIMKPVFATDGHSATLIPVLAWGPGAENFKGVFQNNEVFHKILALTK
ncbi:MAG: alkaline phosphatase [Bacteroidetes bacterium]|nr:alkaline phosphatase [Bacteroidota bacterium]MBL6942748.1 alkaline phosphatase [Bacteroidales bacterium]